MSGSFGVGNERYSDRTRGDASLDALLRLAFRPGGRSLLVKWLARPADDRAQFLGALDPNTQSSSDDAEPVGPPRAASSGGPRAAASDARPSRSTTRSASSTSARTPGSAVAPRPPVAAARPSSTRRTRARPTTPDQPTSPLPPRPMRAPEPSQAGGARAASTPSLSTRERDARLAAWQANPPNPLPGGFPPPPPGVHDDGLGEVPDTLPALPPTFPHAFPFLSAANPSRLSAGSMSTLSSAHSSAIVSDHASPSALHAPDEASAEGSSDEDEWESSDESDDDVDERLEAEMAEEERRKESDAASRSTASYVGSPAPPSETTDEELVATPSSSERAEDSGDDEEWVQDGQEHEHDDEQEQDDEQQEDDEQEQEERAAEQERKRGVSSAVEAPLGPMPLDAEPQADHEANDDALETAGPSASLAPVVDAVGGAAPVPRLRRGLLAPITKRFSRVIDTASRRLSSISADDQDAKRHSAAMSVDPPSPPRPPPSPAPPSRADPVAPAPLRSPFERPALHVRTASSTSIGPLRSSPTKARQTNSPYPPSSPSLSSGRILRPTRSSQLLNTLVDARSDVKRAYKSVSARFSRRRSPSPAIHMSNLFDPSAAPTASTSRERK